jgi:phage baseplate assembly protein gpV
MFQELARTEARLSIMRERLARVVRPCVIAEYDPATHTARAQVNPPGGTPLLTRKGTRILEVGSGGHTSRTTLTVGQTALLLAPFGDIRNAVIIPGSFSDAFKSPSQHGDETMWARGQSTSAVRDGEIEDISGQGRSMVSASHVALEHGAGRVIVRDDLVELGGLKLRIADGVVHINP